MKKNNKNKYQYCTAIHCKKYSVLKSFCIRHYIKKFGKTAKIVNRQIRLLHWKKTFSGLISTTYTYMRTRTRNPKYEKSYLYYNKKLLPRQEFKNWANKNQTLRSLYKQWTMSKYDLRLRPTINRIDSNRGYTLDNMEWMTYSQNSGLVSVSRKLKTKERKVIYSLLGVSLNEK